MNTKKILLGGIVGGVAFFFLGWLIYGNLLSQYFKDHPGTATNIERPMDQFEWWALILGNLIEGFLLAYIFTKSGVSRVASGLITGGIVGLLFAAGIDLIMYATMNFMSKDTLLVDILANAVMWAITGAVVAAVMGMSNRSTATTAV